MCVYTHTYVRFLMFDEIYVWIIDFDSTLNEFFYDTEGSNICTYTRVMFLKHKAFFGGGIHSGENTGVGGGKPWVISL